MEVLKEWETEKELAQKFEISAHQANDWEKILSDGDMFSEKKTKSKHYSNTKNLTK